MCAAACIIMMPACFGGHSLLLLFGRGLSIQNRSCYGNAATATTATTTTMTVTKSCREFLIIIYYFFLLGCLLACLFSWGRCVRGTSIANHVILHERFLIWIQLWHRKSMQQSSFHSSYACRCAYVLPARIACLLMHCVIGGQYVMNCRALQMDFVACVCVCV